MSRFAWPLCFAFVLVAALGCGTSSTPSKGGPTQPNSGKDAPPTKPGHSPGG